MRRGMDTTKLRRNVEAWHRDIVAEGLYPQMQTLVARDGEILLECRHGAHQLQPEPTPLRSDAIFRLYSVLQRRACHSTVVRSSSFPRGR